MLEWAAILKSIVLTTMVKLLVVEDHALVREGLVRTLYQLEGGVDVAEVADFDEACALLEQGASFDLMVLDLGLPGRDGISCLRTFRQRYPAMPVVILSAYDDAHTVNKAMKYGAAGFVSKACSSERLLLALKEVLAGRVFTPELSPSTSFSSLPNLPIGGNAKPSDFGLSDRQAEVLGLMVSGKTNREIGSLLGLSEGTVKIHLTAIFKMLGVSSRTQAMIIVAQHGIKL